MAVEFEGSEEVGIDEFVFEGDEVAGFGELTQGIEFVGGTLEDAGDGGGGGAVELFGKDDGLEAKLGSGLAEHFGELTAADDADGGSDRAFGGAGNFRIFGGFGFGGGSCHTGDVLT